jgi:hypothetical protein
VLKRNPDAPIFCEGSDEALAGVCTHCGSGAAQNAEYCGLECRVKAGEAAASKRIAELEAKVEELRARLPEPQPVVTVAEVTERSYDRLLREQCRDADAGWEEHRRQVRRLCEAMRPRLYGYDYDTNCIPSRASMLVDERREREIAERALKNGDHSPLTTAVNWVNSKLWTG